MELGSLIAKGAVGNACMPSPLKIPGPSQIGQEHWSRAPWLGKGCRGGGVFGGVNAVAGGGDGIWVIYKKNLRHVYWIQNYF